MNRDKALETMAPLAAVSVRDVQHNSTTNVEVLPDQYVFHPGNHGKAMVMTADAVKGAAQYLGIPWKLLSSLTLNSQKMLFNETLENKVNYALLVRDNKVCSIVKPGEYRNFSAERVVKIIGDVIPEADYNRVTLNNQDQSINLEVVGAQTLPDPGPVAVGDLVRAGVQIIFSPLGLINPLVRSYVLRHTCTNGATSNTVLRAFGGGSGDGEGDGDGLRNWFRSSIRAAYKSFGKIVEHYNGMMNENIPPADRAAMLNALIKEARISLEAAETIKAMALERPPQNTYDMMNLITYASSHLITEPRRLLAAQNTVADYTNTETHARICPICRRQYN